MISTRTTPQAGQGSDGEERPNDDVGGTVAAGHLRALIERIEHLEEEIKAMNADKSEVYKEAKGSGYNVKAMRTLVQLRRKDQAERQEDEAILDLYKTALGMV